MYTDIARNALLDHYKVSVSSQPQSQSIRAGMRTQLELAPFLGLQLLAVCTLRGTQVETFI